MGDRSPNTSRLEADSRSGSDGARPLGTPEVGTVLQARHRYRIVRRLGRGGFGSVFLADRMDATETDPGAPPDQVAVKIFETGRNSQAIVSLKRELAALHAIQHDRIPRLFDWNLDGDTQFAVLEYFPGRSLADALPLIGRFDEDQTWRLLADLLLGLQAAHRASILHLDVKPSNVLIDRNGGFVLTDFGVSHGSGMSQHQLSQGRIAIGLGTHGYRAPEQQEATQTFDLRTDLWGVGATAWAMYTGIDLNKRNDVLRRSEDGNVFGLQRISDVRLQCPRLLEEMIMDLLFIDPRRRPGGAAEALDRVRRIASGFGLDSQTVSAGLRDNGTPEDIAAVVASLGDPLWASVCRTPGFAHYFARFKDGEVLSTAGTRDHHTILLLSGRVQVEKDGAPVAVEEAEGALLGAISTLTGAPRSVTLKALGTVWTCIFNEAELEQLVTCNAAVAARMLRNLANRIVNGPPRHRD